MAIDLNAPEDEIFARLDAGINVPVFWDDPWDDDTLDIQNGIVAPYIVVIPGRSRHDKERGSQGIVGPRLDPIKTSVTILVSSGSSTVSRAVWKEVVDLLVGFSPANSTMLELGASESIPRTNNVSKPNTYNSLGAFNYKTNL